MPIRRVIWLIISPRLENAARGWGADYEPFFSSEWTLTSLLPFTSDYPMT
jgi:hypothetical protein